MNASVAEVQPAAAAIRPKLSRDDWTMRAFMGVIALYLLVALAFPLYVMLSKSFEIYSFRLDRIEFQVDKGEGWGETLNALELGEQLGVVDRARLVTSADGRLPATQIFPDFSFRAPTLYRIRNTAETDGGFVVGGEVFRGTDWVELPSSRFRRAQIRPAQSHGFGNFLAYFSTPALFASIYNSLLIATVSTLVTVGLAFAFAYALTRSCMPFKGAFRAISMVPILVPSLLAGIGLIYLFGKQSLVLKVAEWAFAT